MFKLDARSRRELRELQADLRKLDRLTHSECREEFPGVAASVANAARGNAPRLTGRLRDSINDVEVGQDVAVTAGVPYAAIQDTGGRHPVFGRGSVVQPATYFLTNAVQRHEDDFMDAADRAIGSAARRIGFT